MSATISSVFNAVQVGSIVGPGDCRGSLCRRPAASRASMAFE